MKSLRIFLSLIILLFVSIYSCSDDNSPGGNNNGGGSSGIAIATTSVTNITNTSLTSGGNITSDGGSAIIERGVCWSISTNPTIVNTHTSDGAGVGGFISIVSGLTPGTLYYIRAYATNLNTTSYGNQLTIATTAGIIGGNGCAGGPSTVTDIDGNVYNVVSIGNQCWMKENLKTTRYKNGTVIPTGLSNSQWGATTIGACADYNNNSANTSVYGKLYNWYAVADPNGLCPSGWHEPTDSDWNLLLKTIDPNANITCIDCIKSTTAGADLKEIGLTHWASPNTGATNNSGFTGLPGGLRYSGGGYFNLGTNGTWWSASNSSTSIAYYFNMHYNNIIVGNFPYSKKFGFSVRCVRD